jgi:hypothetical protein
MIILVQIVYALFCVILAWFNYLAIKREKKILHWLNAVLHVLCWCYAILFYEHWLVLVILPLVGRLVFDSALNLMRGYSLDYVSPWVKQGNPNSSKIDRVEWQIFHDGLAPKCAYLCLIIIFNILIQLL